MKAVIRSFISPDADLDGELDPALDSLFFQMLVGPVDSDGEESFDLTVCTPAWLAEQTQASGIINGRHLLIVERIDFVAIKEYLAAEVAALDEDTWTDLATKIGRLGRWEFEDYQA
ncbi:hypothetical protein D1871_04165 [Nakamurella silvestris]|nr:hypothetical protein D1871_04165 [Nakamurella silvestris]